MNEEAKQDWYFTFCWGDTPRRNNFVKIFDTFGGARKKMFETNGNYWAFQYNEKEFEDQVPRFDLTEIPL